MTNDNGFKTAYDRGFIDALTAYAVWHDGELRVGAGIYTLARAVGRMEQTYNYNPTPEPTDYALDASDPTVALTEAANHIDSLLNHEHDHNGAITLYSADLNALGVRADQLRRAADEMAVRS